VFPFDEPSFAIAGCAIFLLGYVLFGITGFGASILTVPLLSHFYPLPFVLAVAAILDIGSGLTLGIKRRHDAAVAELKWLVPFAIIGSVLGVTLLVALPKQATMIALGVFIVGYALYGLYERVPAHGISQGWAPLAGTLGGAAGALFGMGGPPYLIYLARRIADKDALRATMSVMVSFSLVIRLTVFAVAGLLFQPYLFIALIWFIPAAALGLWLGGKLHLRMSHATLLRIVYCVLFACGLSLIGRALAAA
jgi:uncharacterized membrane protein YfcA